MANQDIVTEEVLDALWAKITAGFVAGGGSQSKTDNWKLQARTNIGLSNVTNDAQVKRSEMGANGGVATLDGNGKVPSSQLPSFVDDVLEYDSLTDFPATGEGGKIYVAKDTNKTYRWGGTEYTEISASLALGETQGTAYEGSKGKANADDIDTLQGYFTNGVANNAARLSNTNKIGDTNKPVYFTNGGVPVAISYAINRNVAADEDVTAYTEGTSIDISNHVVSVSMTAQPDPTSSGSALDFIDSIVQSTGGVITATKKAMREASGSQSGIVSIGAQTFAGNKTFNGNISGMQGVSAQGICDLGISGGGGGGTTDYADLSNKPKINSVELSGNKTSSDLGLAASSHTHAANDITSGTLATDRIPSLAISKITGLQSELDGKQANLPTSGSAYDISITGNAATATTATNYSNNGGIATAFNSINTALAGKANTSHLYHPWTKNVGYYEPYTCDNNMRMVTESMLNDILRFQAYSLKNVQYWNYDSLASDKFVAWTENGVMKDLSNLFDGCMSEYISIPLDKRKFRFEIKSNSGWPSDAMFVLQGTWFDSGTITPLSGSHYIKVDIETKSNESDAWAVTKSFYFDHDMCGFNSMVFGDLHTGNQFYRITIELPSWSKSANTCTLYRICILSNFSGKPLAPFTFWSNRDIVPIQHSDGNDLYKGGLGKSWRSWKHLYVDGASLVSGLLTCDRMQLNGIENSSISSIHNGDSQITNIQNKELASIREALSFKWYSTDWQIGNIRDDNSDSLGFGITENNSHCVFRVNKSNDDVYAYVNENVVYHAGNANKSTVDWTCQNLTMNGNITPNANNTRSIGSNSLKWANIYATTFNGALSGNASTATKLQTARTIWGQTFDGSGNVSGALTGATTGSFSDAVSTGELTVTGSIIPSSYLHLNNGRYITFKDSNGTRRNTFQVNSDNHVVLGFGFSQISGSNTEIWYSNELRFGHNNSVIAGKVDSSNNLSMNGGISAKGIGSLSPDISQISINGAAKTPNTNGVIDLGILKVKVSSSTTLNFNASGIVDLSSYLVADSGWTQFYSQTVDSVTYKAYCRKIGKVVHLKGSAVATNSGSSSVFCTLPSGYYCSSEALVIPTNLRYNATVRPTQINIQTDGQIYVSVIGSTSYSNIVYLTGISFLID